MKNLTRRTFLKSAGLTSAALALPGRSWGQTLSASDEVRMGVIGFNGRGKDHLKGLAGVKGVRISALCDVDQSILDKEAAQHDGAVAFQDIRKLLESKTIDAVSIATPNHWHALAAIWAVQAGKDVYLEKPVSHNVWEGRKIIEAARKYNKIVQTGTQSRSSSGIKEAFAWIKEGHIGKITLARGLCYKPRPSIGKVDGPQPVPTGIDYDLWCGPAPKKPVMRKKFHYDWHWIWDYGCGDLGNQGIHQMDICRWALGVNELSPSILSIGGRVGYIDDGETANTQIIYHDYAGAPLLFEVRGLPRKAEDKNMDKYLGASVGCIIHCEGGHVLVPDYNKATAYDKEGKELKTFQGSSSGHYQNFINAVRSRKHTDLHADIQEGHLSSALCHTGNISYRLGAQKDPDEIKEAIKAKPFAESYDRMTQHLAANNVDLKASKLALGVPLTMDPNTERFIRNDKANEMLTRDYRKPYVVPEKV